MITATFYNYSGERTRIDKNLTDGTEFTGVLYDGTDVTAPVITFEHSGVMAFNYCHVPALNRYYWVQSQKVMDANHVTIYLAVDVLKTYENEIKTATANRVTVSSFDIMPTIETEQNTHKFLDTYAVSQDVGSLPQTPTQILVTIKGQ